MMFRRRASQSALDIIIALETPKLRAAALERYRWRIEADTMATEGWLKMTGNRLPPIGDAYKVDVALAVVRGAYGELV